MAKKSTATTRRPKPAAPAEGDTGRSPRPRAAPAGGKQLVIVESPTKAKTIGKYLGPDFVVLASVGHIRDLPTRGAKGKKEPVPGVDLEHDFEPRYEVLEGKRKTVDELKKASRSASAIWFATDLDREGEAIAWHLAELLGVPPAEARRVVFNAITKSEIQRAFEHPHPINLDKVNAQQARRILDRIVGYQVSPLLWRKVAAGLSAGRVQSVAVRLVVDREREIMAFVPDERWEVEAELALPDAAAGLVGPWREFLASGGDGKPGRTGPTQKQREAWLSEHGGFKARLVELGGKPFELGCPSTAPKDLSKDAVAVAEAVGLVGASVASRNDPEGKGPARTVRTLTGRIDPAVRYRVRSIETKRSSRRPPPPFITSSLQRAAATYLGFGADRTMRCAQSLYEGVKVPGEGQVGLITYMRTDSTHLSGEALSMVREHISKSYGARYLPEKPNFFGSSNKNAQEAHEAIRPTAASRHPDEIRASLTEDQYKLYSLVWRRFVQCQMTPCEVDQTSVEFLRSDRPTGAVLRASGSVTVFDGWKRLSSGRGDDDEATLPKFTEGDLSAPFGIDVAQSFTSPPPRFNEASLIKKLEDEGIGRPSTYAAILRTIADRKYVEQLSGAYHATDIGMAVTDKLKQGFHDLMEIDYTRRLEGELDRIEDASLDWRQMLRGFYGPFSKALADAGDNMGHAKAELELAPYACPECRGERTKAGEKPRRTVYRLGKSGRFLSCSGYPDCKYAAPIDRQGRPRLPERINLKCPADGKPMVLRTGRFGPFLTSEDPKTKFVLNLDKKGKIKLPAPPPLVTTIPCPKCGKSPLNLRNGKRGPWLGCAAFPKCRGREAFAKIEPAERERLEAALAAHEKGQTRLVLETLDGRPVPEGTPVTDLMIPGGLQTLEIHPDAVPAKSA
jgi:DNA topoisomerase-1